MVKPVQRKYDRGIALLATILAIALMTLLVVDFTTSAALGYRAAANQADALRARYLARSGVAVGLAMLAQDSLKNARQPGTFHPYDSLDKAWAQPVLPIAVDGGTVSLAVVDEARKIDVNLLFNSRTREVDPQYMGILARLFTNIGVSTDLLPILVDWLDPDSVTSPGGAEADYYLRLTPPYEPRNGPMPTIGDLRMLKGSWYFEEDGEFTIAHYSLELAPGFWVPHWLVRVALRHDLPRLLSALRARAESVQKAALCRDSRDRCAG